jgi:hypothetical protein
MLRTSPLILLNAVAGLEAEHMLEESTIPQFFSDMLVTHPKMQAVFSYPGAPNDKSYQANYNHVEDVKLSSKPISGNTMLERQRSPFTEISKDWCWFIGISVEKESSGRSKTPEGK